MSLLSRKTATGLVAGMAVALLSAVLPARGADPPKEPLPTPPPPQPLVLHVAADPNNLPFSNERGEGFENKIAELVARDLGAKLEYSWRAQRRAFFREATKTDHANLFLAVPVGLERVIATRPYYRSQYVFVYRKDRGLHIRSFADPALKTMKVGVQIVGIEQAQPPPAHAMEEHGLVQNVVGYTLYGDYRQPNPPARIIEAVAKGEIDVAVVWGPLAGYFAPRQKEALEVVPVAESATASGIPFAYSIAMGVPKGNRELRNEVDAVLQRRSGEIRQILAEYGVPQLPLEQGKPEDKAQANTEAAGQRGAAR